MFTTWGRVVSSLALLCCWVLVVPPVSSELPVSKYQIKLNLNFSNASLDVRFLSFCLEFLRFETFCDKNSSSMQIFRKLTAALTPAELRLGGSSSNFQTFYPSASSCPGNTRRDVEPKSTTTTTTTTTTPADPTTVSSLYYNQQRLAKINITADQWSRFQYFVNKSGHPELLFDVNVMRFVPNGTWDPANTEQYLQFSSAHGHSIPSFQLGNEPYAYPGNYNMTVDPPLLLQSYQTLKNLLRKYPQYASSKLYGPDNSNINVKDHKWGNKEYTKSFLALGACHLLDEVSFHHYYTNAANVTGTRDLMNVTSLDMFATVIQALKLAIGQSCNRTIGLRLTETSSVSGGGVAGLTDRFVAGFMWLDKLGISAKYGLSRVFRQALHGGSYSLISSSLIFPYTDYYLSVLYKKLVAGPVILASTNPPNPKLRVYANCARNLRYSPGAVVVYYLNLDNSSVDLSFDEFPDSQLDVYLMTPEIPGNLTSKSVRLNGGVLKLNGTELPHMDPTTTTGTVTVAAESYGFIVVPGAKVDLCRTYFSVS